MGFEMGIIKGVLKEELSNSIKMKANYEKALKKHPGGCVVKKSIKGHSYYYLAVREGKKVRFIYKGKEISSADKNALKKSKSLRLKYKKLIRKLNKQIRYLRVVLRGKEDV